MYKKTVVMTLSTVIIAILIVFSSYLMRKFYKLKYCNLQIEQFQMIEIQNEQYIFLSVNIASIEKTFPTAYLLITERQVNGKREINLSIIGRYAVLSSVTRAIPLSAILLPKSLFIDSETIITTGEYHEPIFIVKNTDGIFTMIYAS